jgi:hypothetical protein
MFYGLHHRTNVAWGFKTHVRLIALLTSNIAKPVDKGFVLLQNFVLDADDINTYG